jgi:hypothetical protein
MIICFTRLDAEQTVCAKVVSFHYNAVPPHHSLAVYLAKALWNRMGLQVTENVLMMMMINNDRFHEQS